MPHIRAITVDLWQTIIFETADQDHSRGKKRVQSIRRILQRAGFQYPERVLQEAHGRTWERLCEHWGEERDVSIEEQILIFLECLTPPLRKPSAALQEEVQHAYVAVIFDDPPVAVVDAARRLKDLRREGYRLALISNTGRTPGRCLRLIMEERGFGGLFEYVFFSDEEKVRKPSPEAFRRVLGRLDVQPRECVHIGDDRHFDIQGAMEAGLWTIRYTSPDRRRRRRRRHVSSITQFLHSIHLPRPSGAKDVASHFYTSDWNEIPGMVRSLENLYELRHGPQVP